MYGQGFAKSRRVDALTRHAVAEAITRIRDHPERIQDAHRITIHRVEV